MQKSKVNGLKWLDLVVEVGGRGAWWLVVRWVSGWVDGRSICEVTWPNIRCHGYTSHPHSIPLQSYSIRNLFKDVTILSVTVQCGYRNKMKYPTEY